MRSPVSLIRCLVLGLALAPMVAMGSGVEWLTDLDAARTIAAKKGVPILVDFSGSDWCGWCIRLEREVFSQAAFQTYAKKNLVLVLVDFPRRKKQSKETAERNRALAQQYGIRAFPTVLLLDAKGKVTGRTGYEPGGAEAYVEHIRGLLKKSAG